MKQFRYEAQKNADFIRGILSAATKEDAIEKINEMGLSLIELSEEHAGESKHHILWKKDLASKKTGRLKRIQCHIPVFFRVIEYRGALPNREDLQEKLSTIELKGLMINISPGGVLFGISDPPSISTPNFSSSQEKSFPLETILEAGNIVELCIALPDQEEAVSCTGKLLRIVKKTTTDETTTKDIYHIAVMFMEMSRENHKRIEMFGQSRFASDEAI